MALSSYTTQCNEVTAPPSENGSSGFPNICPELALEIGKAYWIFIGGDVETNRPEPIRIKHYFGNVAGMEIVFMDGGGGFGDILRWVDVGGYVFEFVSTQELYAFKCGNFYTILQAYAKGLMTRADISVIWHLIHGESNQGRNA